MKRGRGRPALGTLARDRVVAIRLTSAELAAIESAIASSGREETVATWAHDRLVEQLGSPDPDQV